MSTSTSASISVRCSYLWDKMLTGPQQDTASSSASFPMLRHHRITPCFERQPNVSERDLVLRPPSPIAVRAATLISVIFPSLMRAKRMRARASTDGVLRFPTGVYSTTPNVPNRVYMHVFAPPPARNCLWSSGLDVASTQQLCSTHLAESMGLRGFYPRDRRSTSCP